MSEKISTPTKKSVSPDWFVRGVLARIGETFDRLTGRNWKPSSSLATSELIEKLKNLLDAEAQDLGEKGRFVPHNIKLKMQWDKFSTDAEDSLKKLENELLIAAIDHINDRRYHTYAPMKLEIAPDYFTDGVKLLASFDEFAETEGEAAINVTVPDLKNIVINPVEESVEQEKELYTAEFTASGVSKKIRLIFTGSQRLSVGRTAENDLQIDDVSVSKIHASLVLSADRQLMIADTGSTNGTFINNQRIAYGKAIPVNADDRLKIGTVEVDIKPIPKAIEERETTILDEAHLTAETVSKNDVNNSGALTDSDSIKRSPATEQSSERAAAIDSNKQSETVSQTAPVIAYDFNEEK